MQYPRRQSVVYGSPVHHRRRVERNRRRARGANWSSWRFRPFRPKRKATDLAASIDIRAERPEDQVAVRAINLSAFDTAAEAKLVDALRAEARPVISLVAVLDDRVVGHIMFSPVTMPGHEALRLMGLAPMAVAPEHQNAGVGSALVRTGLERCAALGIGAVVVLGHPPFYPRFGFLPAMRFGIRSEHDVPPEVFMVVELQPGYLRGAAGTVRYHEAFKDL